MLFRSAESIRSGERFRALAHAAAERAKPLIILKFGKTEAGRKAAASHTGAITGADDVADAAFKQFGVIRVDDCNELYEFAKLLRKRRWPRGKRLAALTGSGGHCVLVADTAASLGLQWAEFAPATGARFEKILPSLVSLANPLDLTSAMTGSPRLFSDSLKVIAEDANVDVLMPILVAPTLGGIDDLVQVNETVGKPVATLWTGYCPEDNAVTVTTLNQRGVPAYRDARMCLRAARAAVGVGGDRARFPLARRRATRVRSAGRHRRVPVVVRPEVLGSHSVRGSAECGEGSSGPPASGPGSSCSARVDANHPGGGADAGLPSHHAAHRDPRWRENGWSPCPGHACLRHHDR